MPNGIFVEFIVGRNCFFVIFLQGFFRHFVRSKPHCSMLSDEFQKRSIAVEHQLFLHIRDNGKMRVGTDRKSTRLNSSHSSISYAVFCFKTTKSPQTLRTNPASDHHPPPMPPPPTM